jgi:hypothetical protein
LRSKALEKQPPGPKDKSDDRTYLDGKRATLKAAGIPFQRSRRAFHDSHDCHENPHQDL